MGTAGTRTGEGGRRLDRDGWSSLLAIANAHEQAAIVERLGSELIEGVQRPLLRRVVDTAVRLRVAELVGLAQLGGLVQRGQGSLAATQKRRHDDAESANQRLRHTLAHMRAQQEDDVEPEAAAVLKVCGSDLAAGCAAAQDLLGREVALGVVMQALAGRGFDAVVLEE